MIFFRWQATLETVTSIVVSKHVNRFDSVRELCPGFQAWKLWSYITSFYECK
ncbi:hypothetical protein PISMIDRAFT_690693 [Pisolithus microcarpus 441]|uniref:Uncharacterized protein n=1 Tax=Pisolithus microcarpus 441 TaxID=765257 RepID=A0A0C9XF69_9AGAM|nr:hypothetical protein PISMIDRAFT_690693 [Pisolithus microcarpus 441]